MKHCLHSLSPVTDISLENSCSAHDKYFTSLSLLQDARHGGGKTAAMRQVHLARRIQFVVEEKLKSLLFTESILRNSQVISVNKLIFLLSRNITPH